MKRHGLLVTAAVIACLFGWGGRAVAQETPTPAVTPEALDKAFNEVPTYEFGKSRECLTVVDGAVRDSYGDPARRKDLEQRLTGIVGGPAATRDAKDFAARQLSLIGTEEAVPALSALLGSEDTADIGRYALERIPGKAADEALMDALAATTGKARIGVINSLGVRRIPAAVPKLALLAKDADSAVAGAAAAALAKTGGPEAARALAKARPEANSPAFAAWADAYLRAADQLRADGKLDWAAKIYQGMRAESLPDPVRVAAFIGYVNTQGEQALSEVVAALAGSDAALTDAATGFVRTMPGKKATDAFLEVFPKLGPEGQVLLLSALADRGDPAARPAAAEAAKSENADVRLAALSALDRLGDASTAPLLAAAAAAAPDKTERDVARTSLDRLRGPDVDGAMAALLQSAEPAQKAEIARSLGARNAAAAVSALLHAAADANEDVRKEAFKSLGALATEKDLHALVALLIKEQAEGARREAERAVVQVAKAIPEESRRDRAILDALSPASAEAARTAIYAVLGQVGAPGGLEVLRNAVKESDGAVQDAAIRALAGWPTPEAVDDLLVLAQAARNETHRILALRGLMRLLELPTDRDLKQTLAYYKKAMEAAATADDRKLVLAGVANVKSLEALPLVKACLKDKELQKEAALAAKKIQASVYKGSASHNPDAAPQALDGNMDSRWRSGEAQRSGMWFQVDLGAVYKVGGLLIDTRPSPNDYPRGYEIYVSDDPENWGEAVAKGAGDGPQTKAAFKPKSGRYVRIVQTGSDEKNFWSIHELKIDAE